MKKINYILLTVIVLTTLLSCDFKYEHNGDLAGNWQLTSWINNSDGKVLATKEDGIYYAVSLDLIKMKKKKSLYYLSTFKQTKDSLILLQSHVAPYDSIVPFSELKSVGVANNGKFRIGKLNKKELILQSEDGTLTFRKY